MFISTVLEKLFSKVKVFPNIYSSFGKKLAKVGYYSVKSLNVLFFLLNSKLSTRTYFSYLFCSLRLWIYACNIELRLFKDKRSFYNCSIVLSFCDKEIPNFLISFRSSIFEGWLSRIVSRSFIWLIVFCNLVEYVIRSFWIFPLNNAICLEVNEFLM